MLSIESAHIINQGQPRITNMEPWLRALSPWAVVKGPVSATARNASPRFSLPMQQVQGYLVLVVVFAFFANVTPDFAPWFALARGAPTDATRRVHYRDYG